MSIARTAAIATSLLALPALPAGHGAAPAPPPFRSDPILEPSDTMHATGTFDVKVTPVANDEAEGSTLGRMTIEKQFHGDLEGTSEGEMLTAMTAVDGSAGYVAVERVTGTLHGRRGSFVLQHSGSMARGAQQLSITVVPDSGTGELTGIGGTMSIVIDGGEHSYVLEYTCS